VKSQPGRAQFNTRPSRHWGRSGDATGGGSRDQ
jgi:hypothetical protein